MPSKRGALSSGTMKQYDEPARKLRLVRICALNLGDGPKKQIKLVARPRNHFCHNSLTVPI